MQQPSKMPAPPWVQDENQININLIAMLLWQSLLVGVSVGVSHMEWYLPNAGPGEMGLQYGLICFGFLCLSMVLFHVGGLRDSLAMRAEFAQESRIDKWNNQQQRLQARRMRKYEAQQQRDMYYQQNMNGQQQAGMTTFSTPIPQIVGEESKENGDTQ